MHLTVISTAVSVAVSFEAQSMEREKALSIEKGREVHKFEGLGLSTHRRPLLGARTSGSVGSG
jgi:hypothetical protein